MAEIALTRGVPPSIVDCELTFLEREPIDYGRARAQHQAYCRLLEQLGLTLLQLAADPRLPDCCFVEDTAVVLDEVAVLARPGAPSRRPEVDAVAEALAPFRPLRRIAAPARLDGGDVMVLGRRVFVGQSRRSDSAGQRALAEIIGNFGYQTTPVTVGSCLHLKSAATAIGDDAVIVNPQWVDPATFGAVETMPVPAEEPWAANVLRIGDSAIIHAGFPRTADLLAKRGLDVRTVDVSEFLKAEAGVTCKSLLL